MREIDKYEDIIDSRDLEARIEELKAERQDLQDIFDDADTMEEEQDAQEEITRWDSEYADELEKLEVFAEQCRGYGDWDHGETLIRDSHFENYAQQMAEDCGLISGTEGWPLNCIDWEQAARELQMDYSSAEFDGVTYYFRS